MVRCASVIRAGNNIRRPSPLALSVYEFLMKIVVGRVVLGRTAISGWEADRAADLILEKIRRRRDRQRRLRNEKPLSESRSAKRQKQNARRSAWVQSETATIWSRFLPSERGTRTLPDSWQSSRVGRRATSVSAGLKASASAPESAIGQRGVCNKSSPGRRNL